jgi:hypothetical protein
MPIVCGFMIEWKIFGLHASVFSSLWLLSINLWWEWSWQNTESKTVDPHVGSPSPPIQQGPPNCLGSSAWQRKIALYDILIPYTSWSSCCDAKLSCWDTDTYINKEWIRQSSRCFTALWRTSIQHNALWSCQVRSEPSSSPKLVHSQESAWHQPGPTRWVHSAENNHSGTSNNLRPAMAS